MSSQVFAKIDNWYPASGGTEKVFQTRTGHKLLYVWHPASGKHAYLNVETDQILSEEEANLALLSYKIKKL
jgi:hypothetical protein